jgi:hypothetical protein
VLYCKKCDSYLCHNSDCKRFIDLTICVAKKEENAAVTIKREYLKRQNNSEQILPINEFKIAPRIRSFSDPDPSLANDLQVILELELTILQQKIDKFLKLN